mmetsp:Transcript_22678/g.44160  ORF Transcript_22678/g.44160 Transcript_22678/m.44160 type:complete len:344 (-) Transcript_22678:255-1286(-)
MERLKKHHNMKQSVHSKQFYVKYDPENLHQDTPYPTWQELKTNHQTCKKIRKDITKCLDKFNKDQRKAIVNTVRSGKGPALATLARTLGLNVKKKYSLPDIYYEGIAHTTDQDKAMAMEKALNAISNDQKIFDNDPTVFPKSDKFNKDEWEYQTICNNFFKNYRKESNEMSREENDIVLDCLEGTPTKEEISEAIKLLKKDVAPGEDGIIPRIFLETYDEVAQYIIPIVQNSFWVGQIPPSADPKEYRPVALASVLLKLFERIMLTRILITMNIMAPGLTAQQAGWQPGRSMYEPLIVLLENIKRMQAKSRVTGYLSLDLRKFFDRILGFSLSPVANLVCQCA